MSERFLRYVSFLSLSVIIRFCIVFFLHFLHLLFLDRDDTVVHCTFQHVCYHSGNVYK